MGSIIELILFLIPSYVSNSSPVILGGGPPIDMKTKFLGKRLLGDSKTIIGFVGGVIAGSIIAFLLSNYQLSFYSTQQEQILGGVILSFGAMLGDSIGSFIKRRLGIEPGEAFFPDTVIFLTVALILVSPVVSNLYTIKNLIFMFGLTMILHPLTNILANKAGLKNVPW